MKISIDGSREEAESIFGVSIQPIQINFRDMDRPQKRRRKMEKSSPFTSGKEEN
ncbi:MAG: hypothetical protein WBB29_21610 [Geitlerinemataceae cyanobacterium]